MRFTWDETKNLSNIKDHKISFVQAAYIFSDPLRKEYYDKKHSDYEDRFIAIGMAENRMLFVSFTEPDTETIHIISARKADRQERRFYYGNS